LQPTSHFGIRAASNSSLCSADFIERTSISLSSICSLEFVRYSAREYHATLAHYRFSGVLYLQKMLFTTVSLYLRRAICLSGCERKSCISSFVKDFGALEIVGRTQIGDLTKLTTLFAAGCIVGSTCSAEDLQDSSIILPFQSWLLDVPAPHKSYPFPGELHRIFPMSSMHNGTLE
jgi:hypothetical protein